MTQKSEVVERLDWVQQELLKLVKPLGYRRKGRTFTRTVDTDVQQIIALQAGPFEIGPPLPPAAAHLRPDLCGKFAVNLGVFGPEMYERANPRLAPRRVVTDAHCSIRTRLGRTASHDFWWSLAADLRAVVDDIGTLLIDEGIPFLDRFGSRHAIVRDWVKFNENELSLTRVARLDTAMVVLRQGDIDAAQRLLQDHMDDYRKDPTTSPGHGAYVQELTLRLGLGRLR